jgi:hypothetical protein
MMSDGITGRDRLIIAKALAYAVIAIERLPEEWRAASDLNDMKTLLNSFSPKLVQTLMITARSHLERRGLDPDSSELKLADRNGDVVPIR